MKRILLSGRNDQLPRFLSSRVTPPKARDNSARSVTLGAPERAVSYDATDDRWIHPPSGATPDAAGAAEPRQVARVRKYPSHYTPGPAVILSPPRTAGYLREVLEFFVVVIGIGVSAAVAVLLWAVMS